MPGAEQTLPFRVSVPFPRFIPLCVRDLSASRHLSPDCETTGRTFSITSGMMPPHSVEELRWTGFPLDFNPRRVRIPPPTLFDNLSRANRDAFATAPGQPRSGRFKEPGFCLLHPLLRIGREGIPFGGGVVQLF